MTSRETEALRMAAQGLSSKEMADRLGITVKAVDQRLARAGRKLNAANRTHAVVKALQRCLIRP